MMSVKLSVERRGAVAMDGRVAATAAWACCALCIAIALTAGRLDAQALKSDAFVKGQGLLSRDKVHPSEDFKAAVVIEVKEGYHVNADTPAQEYLIATKAQFAPLKGFKLGKIAYPKYVERTFEFSEQPLRVFEGRQSVVVPVSAGAKVPVGKFSLECQLRVQACSDDACFAPATMKVTIPLEVVARNVETHEANVEVFSTATAKSKDEDEPPTAGEQPSSESGNTVAAGATGGELGRKIAERGLLLTFIGIFFGGLALNLTPCVYPLIPITVGYFGGQSDGRASRTMLLAVFYVLGIAMTYSALGVFSAMAGQLLGSALQSPAVLMFIAAVLVTLALSMFGLYEIQPATFITRRAGAKKGFVGSLAMGLLVGLVAAPCLAPVLAGLLTYVATTRNPVLGFWMFFTLAVGMGLPYIFLGAFAGSVKALPKSGVWMVWVKKLFGAMLLGAAVYVLAPLLPLAAERRIAVAFLVVGGVYLGWLDSTGKSLPRFSLTKRLIGSTAMLAALWIIARPPAAATTKVQWEKFSAARVAEAAAGKTPVIIDFYADWCLECKQLDAETYTDPRVVEKAQRFVLLKSDLTRNSDSKVRRLYRQFGIIGLPTVVFLDDRGREISELRVEGFVDADAFLTRMEKLVS
ncbi:MAG: hypothetical protein AUJ92_12985 [Armatimonadetes bacterium CG2_30_59_28]|nr:thioredoxin fold domain-containing protein [Armatimonadota bacterium]OIO93086.1 MAG: hypothetical protein AUJ92_12985 [Armatimonadetes bacterium CG2_30_59_28]